VHVKGSLKISRRICYENETKDEKSSSENFDYAKGNYEAMKQELDLIKWE